MAGVADIKWAVDNAEPAAQAFKLNNPECTVFSDDCNLLLTNAITGVKTNERGQVIPLRGQVDLLCGGPPCQAPLKPKHNHVTITYSFGRASLV